MLNIHMKTQLCGLGRGRRMYHLHGLIKNHFKHSWFNSIHIYSSVAQGTDFFIHTHAYTRMYMYMYQ